MTKKKKKKKMMMMKTCFSKSQPYSRISLYSSPICLLYAQKSRFSFTFVFIIYRLFYSCSCLVVCCYVINTFDNKKESVHLLHFCCCCCCSFFHISSLSITKKHSDSLVFTSDFRFWILIKFATITIKRRARRNKTRTRRRRIIE